MAQDYAGLLTGLDKRPPNPMAGMDREGRMAYRAQGMADTMGRGLVTSLGMDARTDQERTRDTIGSLKLNTTDKLQQERNVKTVREVDPVRAQKLAQMYEAQNLAADEKKLGMDTRQAIAAQVRAAGYDKMADAIVKEAGSGSELALQGGIKILTNLAQPAKPTPKTILTPEEELELFRKKKSFEDDLSTANKAEETATQQSAQYLPVLEQMNALTDTVDFGVGSTAIADINNTLHSLAVKAGLNPEPLKANVDATATYNSLSKRLKAWLLEAQKGAISNLENTEITKNTANPNMTKNQAKALVNYSQASLMSANNKAQEQKQWLLDNGTLIGFEKAWGKYTEDFPRTEGFLTVKDLDGKTDSIQANFKPIRSNMELFSLYANNKGKPPVFVSKEGKGITLEKVKKEIIQDQIDELKKGNPNFKPTKEQLSLYELNARRKIGQLVSLRLNNGTYTVTK